MAWGWDNIDWIATATVISGCGAAVQAGVAVIMLRSLRLAEAGVAAAHRAIDQQRALSQTELRAYLAFGMFEVRTPEDLSQPLIIEARVLNAGATPARDVRALITAGTCEAELIDGMEGPTADEVLADEHLVVMRPGGEATLRCSIPADAWVNVRDRLADGSWVIGCAIRIHYTDVFGELRWTTTRAQLANYGGGGDHKFSLLPRGNDAN